MELEAKVIQIFPLQQGTSKAGKAWQKQEILTETLGQYPHKILLTLFGKALENVRVVEQGVYKFGVDISSRDYTNPSTGKTSWFTEVSAYSATPVVQSAPPQQPPMDAYQQVQTLYNLQPQQPSVFQQPSTPQGGDGLPF